MKLREDILNVRVIEHVYGASWTGKGFVRAPDMADFGPLVKGQDPLADYPPPAGRPKPVRYLPVKKEGNNELFPPVSIELGLSERGRMQSVSVPAWEGASVEIEVANVWDEKNVKTVKLTGTLDKLLCVVHVDANTVKSWLDPQGPFGARVNENLFEFRFEIPKIVVKGKPYSGESSHRLFFYRRKILVFFPAVFGSQVQVKAPDGQKVGFPDFFDESTSRWWGLTTPGLARMVDHARHQRIGVLECDAGGKPLAEPDDPKLFMMTLPVMGGYVYDVFENLKRARQEHFKPLPPDFRLYRLFVSPYDWRLDLTETAKEKVKQLKQIQEGVFCRKAPDTDDQLAVAGHSTGGLIIRRMLAEPDADQLISHAFFMNVPFRGAPKTLSVISTGCDPLHGDRMIQFVVPESMRAIGLTAPILYHLSASSAYPDAIFTVKTDAGEQTYQGLEAEKKWVDLAIEKGFMPPRKVVLEGAPLGKEVRRKLALGADDWVKYWDELWERKRNRVLIEWMRPGDRDEWAVREITERKLLEQDLVRVEQGWNEKLAERARQFHEDCEQVAKSGSWKEKAFIFYSVAEELTTLGIEARLLFSKRYSDKISFLKEMSISMNEIVGHTFKPPEKEKGKREPKPLYRDKDYGPVEEGVWIVESWTRQGGDLLLERWRFAAIRQIDGDGTVPVKSLIGFGGPAQVFKKLANDEDEAGEWYAIKDAKTRESRAMGLRKTVLGPDHANASKNTWLWSRIVEVLQGHDVTEHLADESQANLENGNDTDERLDALKLDRYLRKG